MRTLYFENKLPASFVVAILTLFFGGCQKGTDNQSNGSKALNAPIASALLAEEDVLTIHSGTLASGTVITGSIEPERRADLHAEISAVVLQVMKENGESVRRGDLLMRLDDTAIRDGLTSAEASARAAGQALDQAERQFQRLKTLRGSGMASAQQLEDAEIHRNTAQSDKAAADSRVVQARQQLQRTEIRAPFDGVVSERKTSAGDTAALGKELIKVIDPTSARFDGFVSADKISTVKLGQTVSFRINGYGQQDFTGVVKRIDATADPTTRQVEVFVNFTSGTQPGVSGLYAEGRIETTNTAAIMLPAIALVNNGDHPYVWRLQNGSLKKTSIVLGVRDSRHGDYAVTSGLADGDHVIRNPQSTLTYGEKVELFSSIVKTNDAEKSAISAVKGK